MADRPNILWICTDSQRWDTLGCYGNQYVRTPHADRLAERGVTFNHAYSQSPLCTPSRGSFLTGRYPITTRLRQNGQDIPESEVLIPRMLHDDGYVCGLVGKLHLSACDHRIKRFGADAWKHDREEYFAGTERRINDGYDEFHWDHAPGLINRSSAYTRWVLEQGADIQERNPCPDCKYIYEGPPEAFHQTTWCFQTASNFVRAYAGSVHPWMLSLNVFDPHFQFNPPREYLERYLDRLDDLPLPNYVDGELDNKPPGQLKRTQNQHYPLAEMTERDHRYCRAAYWAMCDLIDVHLGKLLDTLEQSGQADNTIVIFMSDHGEMLGDHGIYQKGALLYDPAVRVPLIVHWPGRWEGGRRHDDLIELCDLAPTLLEAVGLERHPGMQAKSMTALLDGDATEPHREDIYCEYLNGNPSGNKEYCTMIRTHQAKIIVHHGKPVGELYDLASDPNETTNLWDEPAATGLKLEMLKRASDRQAFTCDPLPPRIGIF